MTCFFILPISVIAHKPEQRMKKLTNLFNVRAKLRDLFYIIIFGEGITLPTKPYLQQPPQQEELSNLSLLAIQISHLSRIFPLSEKYL